jgi:hypothetical protein
MPTRALLFVKFINNAFALIWGGWRWRTFVEKGFFWGEEIKWVNTVLPRMRRGSVFLYDLWRELFFFKVRWMEWGVFAKKIKKKHRPGG